MKADTMNEKTIELPVAAEWALQLAAQAWCEPSTSSKVMDAELATVFAQMLTRLAAEYDRSRAASEPGEVARLADIAKEAMNAAYHHGRAYRTVREDHAHAFANARRDELLAIIDRLAGMATSPASEVQAGLLLALEQERQKFQQETRRTSELSVLLQKWIDRHVAEHGPGPWARRCDVCSLVGESQELLGKPINTASPQAPVAAEGQKARPLWLQDNPAGAAERDRLEWKFIAKTLADCRKRIEADGSRHSWLDAAENIARERATPTASMADAAEAAQHDESDPLQQLTDLSQELGLYEFPNKPLYATPGPRGENAGGVVEALSREQLEPLWRKHCHAIGVIAVQDFNFACAVMNACATAWGLRIAEKGDAS